MRISNMLFLLSFIVFFLNTAQAQFVLEKEYAQKIDQSGAFAPYVFFLEQYGILLAQRESVSSTFFAMRCLNTQLVMKWQSRQDLPLFTYKNIQRYFDREHGYFYLMGQNMPPSKNVALLKIDLNSGSMTYEEYDLNVLCILIEFKVIDDNVFMHVLREQQPAVLLKQAGENTAKVLPILFDNTDRLLQMHEDFVSNALYFFCYSKQKLENNVVPFSNLLGVQKVSKLFDNSQYTFNHFQLKPFESKHKLMMGTFAKSINGVALGVFSKVFDPNTNDPGKFRFLRFVDMPSIYAHLPEKRQAKIKATYMHLADKGKNPSYLKNMEFRTTLYNLKPDEVVLKVEGYYENTGNVKFQVSPVISGMKSDGVHIESGTGASTYSIDTQTGNYYINSAQTVASGYNPLSGYLNNSNFGDYYRTKFPHNLLYSDHIPPRLAILVGLDKEGEKQWDNQIILNEPFSNKLQVGTLGGDSLVLAYFKKRGITSKLIYQNTTLIEEETQDFKDLFPTSFSYEFPISFERLQGEYFVLYGHYTNPINGESFMSLRLMRYTVQ